MCNEAAGLSRCLTKVQDSIVTQLKTLCGQNQGQGSRTNAAGSGGVRILGDLQLVNFSLARRGSYLEFICGGVKPDTLTALCTAPVHLHSLFPDSLLVKALDEISRSEERRSSGSSHWKPGRFHPYASSSGRSTQQPDRKPTTPAWEQIRDQQIGQKGRGKASNFTQKLAKGSNRSK